MGERIRRGKTDRLQHIVDMVRKAPREMVGAIKQFVKELERDEETEKWFRERGIPLDKDPQKEHDRQNS